jgi:hypothetical protein
MGLANHLLNDGPGGVVLSDVPKFLSQIKANLKAGPPQRPEDCWFEGRQRVALDRGRIGAHLPSQASPDQNQNVHVVL